MWKAYIASVVLTTQVVAREGCFHALFMLVLVQLM